MRVLVTGAAGFIGSHILEAARDLGYEVRGFDSLTPAVHDGMPRYIPEDADMVVADVRDAAAVSRALAGVDVVCHQAALVGLGVDLSDLPGYCDVNVTGTATLLNAMGQAGVQRLVLASSMVVYGEGAYDCARHGRVRPGPARAGRPGRGAVRAALPAMRGAAGHRHRHRGCPDGSAQRLRGQQAGAGASGRHVGPPDRGPLGRAALSQRLRPEDAAGHALLRGGGHLPVRAGEARSRRRSSKTGASSATSCTSPTWPRPTCSR